MPQTESEFIRVDGESERDPSRPPSPTVLRLDLRSPSSAAAAATSRDWLGKLERLQLTVDWPSSEAQVRGFLDQASALADRRPHISLRICNGVPDSRSLPTTVDRVELPFSMEEELLARDQEEALSSLSGLLQQRGVELVLELPVHQGNWIHLRAWLARARRLHAKVALRFVSGGEAKSLGELDGDALASVHGIFRQWFREYPLQPDSSEASRISRSRPQPTSPMAARGGRPSSGARRLGAAGRRALAGLN